VYKLLIVFFLAALSAVLQLSNVISDPIAYAKTDNPVVLELYTSQGCSSCPPAEALLNELADRDDLIPLALHVDYWDHIGWKDPYGSAEHSLRQRHYSGVLGKNGTGRVYTPQLIINGKYETVGSNWMKINKLTKNARADVPMATIKFEDSPDGNLLLRIANVGKKIPTNEIDIWLYTILDTVNDKITRGENRGKMLTSRNVVSGVHKIGVWNNGEATILLDRKNLSTQGDAIAVVLQGKSLGHVIGAGRHKFR
jgi:hypothetical protein